MMPRLYAIADAGVLAARGIKLDEFARELRAAGVGLVQYRDKTGSPEEILRAAAVLRGIFPNPTSQNRDVGHPGVFAESGATLILNDRADLAVLAGFGGIHVGQKDLSPEDARRVVGPNRIVGVSTHTDAQVSAADAGCANHIAIGPVFGTRTKTDTEPVVGLEGVRRARALTRKPLVAIGGITRANARSVMEAGADSIALISGLLTPGESGEKVARDFLELLG